MTKSSPEYQAAFSADIEKLLKKKYATVKPSVQRKVDQILQDPLQQTEPLRHGLVGLRSAPVRKNYILILAVCEECRRLGHEAKNNCPDCSEMPNNTVYFFIVAPHDDAYAIAKKLRDRERMTS